MRPWYFYWYAVQTTRGQRPDHSQQIVRKCCMHEVIYKWKIIDISRKSLICTVMKLIKLMSFIIYSHGNQTKLIWEPGGLSNQCYSTCNSNQFKWIDILLFIKWLAIKSLFSSSHNYIAVVTSGVFYQSFIEWLCLEQHIYIYGFQQCITSPTIASNVGISTWVVLCASSH